MNDKASGASSRCPKTDSTGDRDIRAPRDHARNYLLVTLFEGYHQFLNNEELDVGSIIH